MLLTNTLGAELAFSTPLIPKSATRCDSEPSPSSSEHQNNIHIQVYVDLHIIDIDLPYIIYFMKKHYDISYCVLR